MRIVSLHDLQDVAWARFDPQVVYYVGGFGG